MIEQRQFLIGGRMAAPTTDRRDRSHLAALRATLSATCLTVRPVISTRPWRQRGQRCLAIGVARPRPDRVEVMNRLLAECRERAGEFGTAQVTEMGCPISQVNLVMVEPAFGQLEYYTSLAAGTSFESAGPGWVVRASCAGGPVGVVGAIVPWNGPPDADDVEARNRRSPRVARWC